MVRALVLVVWLVVMAASARAETIALLPLDADKRLEVYGHPVAAEIGRALKAAGIDVVVVGAKMAVPDKAQLIVDGTIKAAKGNAIALSLRIRDPRDGTVLETLPASAATLTTIDRAAAELSAKLVPAAKSHLAALAKPPTPTVTPVTPGAGDRPSNGTPAAPVAPATSARRMPLVLAAVASPPGMPALELLAGAMTREVADWAALRRREAKTIAPDALNRVAGVRTVGEQGAEVGVAFEVLGFSVEPGQVPLARARVRVRVIADGALKLERVIRTDTIVGDRGIADHELAARAAREVLAIANAQLRREVAGWK